jgi:hypothetical protein
MARTPPSAAPRRCGRRRARRARRSGGATRVWRLGSSSMRQKTPKPSSTRPASSVFRIGCGASTASFSCSAARGAMYSGLLRSPSSYRSRNGRRRSQASRRRFISALPAGGVLTEAAQEFFADLASGLEVGDEGDQRRLDLVSVGERLIAAAADTPRRAVVAGRLTRTRDLRRDRPGRAFRCWSVYPTISGTPRPCSLRCLAEIAVRRRRLPPTA